MSESRARWSVAAVVALSLLSLAAGVTVAWASASIQLQLNALYAANNGSMSNDVADYAEINRLGSLGYLLQQLTTPLVFSGVVALFVAIVLLTVWWHRREQPQDALIDADADAASTAPVA